MVAVAGFPQDVPAAAPGGVSPSLRSRTAPGLPLMYDLLSAERVTAHTRGHYHSEGTRQSSDPQPCATPNPRSGPPQSGEPGCGLGRGREPSGAGGRGGIRQIKAGAAAAFPQGASRFGATSGRAEADRSGEPVTHAPGTGRTGTLLALALIRFYQSCLSPLIPAGCRFYPTCSEYAHEAIAQYGLARGVRMAGARLLACRPWGGWGFDPVPPALDKEENGSR
jgi:putative membrane protein insertion efficiency factor